MSLIKEKKTYFHLASSKGPCCRSGDKLGSTMGRDPSCQESEAVSNSEFHVIVLAIGRFKHMFHTRPMRLPLSWRGLPTTGQRKHLPCSYWRTNSPIHTTMATLKYWRSMLTWRTTQPRKKQKQVTTLERRKEGIWTTMLTQIWLVKNPNMWRQCLLLPSRRGRSRKKASVMAQTRAQWLKAKGRCKR